MNLKQLRELALEATQDPHAFGSKKCKCGHPVCNKWHLNMASSNGGIEEKDALFISKFHPQTILALLDLVESSNQVSAKLMRHAPEIGFLVGADEALAAYEQFNKE